MLLGFLGPHSRVDMLSLELFDQVSMWFKGDFLLDGSSTVGGVFSHLLDIR